MHRNVTPTLLVRDRKLRMIGGKKGRKVLLHVDRMNSIYPPQKQSERVVAKEGGGESCGCIGYCRTFKVSERR